ARTQLEAEAVDALDTHIIAVADRRLLGWRRFRTGQWLEQGVGGPGRAYRPLEHAARNQQRRPLRSRPDHWPGSRRDREPDFVTGGKHRARIVELNMHAVTLSHR